MDRVVDKKGFLIVEVLIAILILAVVFVPLMAAMAQSARVASRSSQTTEAVSRYEALLFEVESGLRPDIAGYGGRGELDGQYRYEIDPVKSTEYGSFLKSRLSWKGGKEFLDVELLATKGVIQ